MLRETATETRHMTAQLDNFKEQVGRHSFRPLQGPHSTGKTGKMAKKKSLSGKTQGIWKFCQNTGKTQGILFAQVVNSLILKVKDTAIFAVIGQGKHRENTGNLKIQFEWVPCICESVLVRNRA